ncbi:MAG TPA: twin-arginine translocase subunit TatC [Anaerolineaceae bacterium]|nr:twin-arginine translocase subunit TatC [Anaerolineaceae bacterium]
MGENSMPLMDHLEELRRRIIICAVAILVVTLAAFFVSDWLLKIILLPSGGLQLRAFNLLDGFMIKWRLALYTGIVISFPIWAYQIYRFVSPGMYESERRAIFPTVFGAMLLFGLGAIFGYYLLWGMIRVLIEFFPTEVQFLPSADDYISFVVFFLLACGLAFQLPTVLIILVHLHILNTNILRKQRRIAYFALFAFAEIITPVSDPIVAPLTVMVPLVVLYEISIFLARRIEVRREKEEAKQLAQT